ncbi:MAG: HD-GYP domain-containing protein [Saccharospirillum sp.]
MTKKQYSVPPATLWEHQACIDPAHLAVGHFVAALDRPWADSPFLLEGVLIDSYEDKAWLVDHCAWVIIDLNRSRNKLRPVSHAPAAGYLDILEQQPASHPINTLRTAKLERRTLRAALAGYSDLNRQAHRLLDAFANGKALDIPKARQAVEGLSSALDKNLSAMVWLTRIKHKDQYTAEHCINVAILSMGLAHALEWPQDQVESAGLTGLLHDLGKMKVDQGILNKPGRLTPEEFDHLKTHSRLGYDLLQADDALSDDIKRAVLHHHERPDGHGYPSGLPQAQIPPLAALVSVVDAYDAITSHRIYDAARSHHEALSILWQQKGTQFCQTMVEAFIQFMGWVTPGTLVRLSDESLAVVLQARLGQRLKPVVQRLVKTEARGYQPAEVVDLATCQPGDADEQPASLNIRGVLPDGFDGIDLKGLSLTLT